jgi:hypothetical protein
MEVVMSDLVKTTAADEAIEPFASSADGKLNSFTLTCLPTEQSMNYAACLWRQGVLAKPDINTPADWSTCRTAAKTGACPALQMRQEEELAGKSIYFRGRNLLRLAGEAASRWLMPPITSKRAAPPPPPKAVSRPTSMLDAMGRAGDLSDAVSAAAASHAASPRAPRAPIPIVTAAFTGESPLAMARRLAATRTTTH